MEKFHYLVKTKFVFIKKYIMNIAHLLLHFLLQFLLHQVLVYNTWSSALFFHQIFSACN